MKVILLQYLRDWLREKNYKYIVNDVWKGLTFVEKTFDHLELVNLAVVKASQDQPFFSQFSPSYLRNLSFLVKKMYLLSL